MDSPTTKPVGSDTIIEVSEVKMVMLVVTGVAVTSGFPVGMPDKPVPLSVKYAGVVPLTSVGVVLIVAVPKVPTVMPSPAPKPAIAATYSVVAVLLGIIVVLTADPALTACPSCTSSIFIDVCACDPWLDTMFMVKVYVTTAAATAIAMSSNVAMIGLTARLLILRFLRFFILRFFIVIFSPLFCVVLVSYTSALTFKAY
jgi:hypothetical protein